MYCTNCGNEVNPNAPACLKCSANPRKQRNYCANCGSQVHPNAVVCVSCGAAIRPGIVYPQGGEMGDKDWLTTLLLCIFFGYLGIHRFYTGHTGIGVIQLLTGGGCGVWYLIDLIYIIIGKYKDANGSYLYR